MITPRVSANMYEKNTTDQCAFFLIKTLLDFWEASMVYLKEVSSQKTLNLEMKLT